MQVTVIVIVIVIHEERPSMRNRVRPIRPIRAAVAALALLTPLEASALTTFPATKYYVGGPQDPSIFEDPAAAAASVCAFSGWTATPLVPDGENHLYDCVAGNEVKSVNAAVPNYGCFPPTVPSGVRLCRCGFPNLYDGRGCVTPASCVAPRVAVDDACVCPAGTHAEGATCVPDCTKAKCDAACSGSTLPVSFPPFEYAWSRATVACPAIFGGSAGFAVTASGQFDGASAVCGSGCKATETKKFKGNPTFSLCGSKGASRGGSAILELSTVKQTTFAKKCSMTSCSTECDETKKCEEESFTGTLTGGVAWNASVSFAKGTTRGMFAVGVFCEGSATLQAGGTLASKSTTDRGYGAGCPSCQETTFGPRLFGKASGNCTLAAVRDLPKGAVGSGSLGTDAVKGLSIEYAQDMLYTQKSGACGESECFTSAVSAKASVDIPSKCLSTFGRGVKLQVKVSAGGTCRGSTCSGQPSDGCSFNPDVATIVAKTCTP